MRLAGQVPFTGLKVSDAKRTMPRDDRLSSDTSSKSEFRRAVPPASQLNAERKTAAPLVGPDEPRYIDPLFHDAAKGR